MHLFQCRRGVAAMLPFALHVHASSGKWLGCYVSYLSRKIDLYTLNLGLGLGLGLGHKISRLHLKFGLSN